MIATLFILGFTAIGSVAAMFAATKAPMGYQDETGFHYGPAQSVVEVEAAYEVGQPKFA